MRTISRRWDGADSSRVRQRSPRPGPAVAGLATAPPAAAATRPNVLLIITDDQPKHTDWATPKTIDWLVGQGVKFTNGHVTTPLCAPSRSSVFSGRYAHNHGVRDNGHPYKLDQSTTVQRHLKQAGYRTGLFGKYLNAWNVDDNPPHFEEWVLEDPVVYNDGTYNVNGTVQTIAGYSTTVIKNRALAFLSKAATDTRPWFAVVTPKASHEPNTPETKYANTVVPDWNGRPSVAENDRSDKPDYIQSATATLSDAQALRQRQLRTLLSVDDAVQAFKDKLASLGQLDNTLVIYLGDNGYTWADHGWLKKSVPYLPSIEVPFYLSWPAGGLGVFPALNTGTHRGTAPAKSYRPNGYGLYNTAGNVSEWCADWFSADFHRARPRDNPTGPSTGLGRVMRGGSHMCHESYCNRYRVGARSSNTPDSSTGNIGFRVAASPA
ncbi:sulfatase-like hydrolase/transferase [Streptomyces sirii]|uniref:sulfatase-like hydrolase/transferase n=1 Tax=Streptomyces sirii TaxID=3127701 RepID=UPI003D35A25F